MLPHILRTFLAKRKPATRQTATERAAELRGIPVETLLGEQCTLPAQYRWNQPETQRETWVNDNLPDIARRGEGE